MSSPAATTAGFTDEQVRALAVLSRVGGALSLAAVLLVFAAYAMFGRLRTVPNTFLLFASAASAGASVACLIAYDGVWSGQAGALCQAQGFLFEMFVQSDPWWSLAMAVNVTLVLYRGANTHTVMRWGWLYCAVCYGGPFMAALVCLMLRDADKTAVYGSSGIWCWISNDWNSLRIFTHYMLVWICIVSSLAIYLGIGIQVLRARNKPEEDVYAEPAVCPDTPWSRRTTTSLRDWPLKPSPGDTNIFSGAKAASSTLPADSASSPFSPFSASPITRPWNVHSPAPSPRPRGNTEAVETEQAQHSWILSPPPVSPAHLHKRPAPVRRLLRRRQQHPLIADPAKRAHLRAAALFAASVALTWVPGSAERIRSLLVPSHPQRHQQAGTHDTAFAYSAAAAAVLPLQGVWNAAIFFATSWPVLRECVTDMLLRRDGVTELIDRPVYADSSSREQRRKGKMVDVGKGRHGDKSNDVEQGVELPLPLPAMRWETAGPRTGLGITWKPVREARRPVDSWDFLDIGTVSVGSRTVPGSSKRRRV